MKKNCFVKRIFCVVAACFLFASSLCAISWSGVIDDNTKISTSEFLEFSLFQSNGVYFSVNSNLGDSGLRLSSECSYKYKTSIPFSSINSSTFTNVVDLLLLKLSGTWALSNGAISLNIGRFNYSDLSGVIFTQNSDGVYVSYDSMKLSAGIYAGYTGLQNSLNVSMLDSYNYDYDFYNLCAGYIPILANFAYKSFLKTNTIALQLSGFLEPKKDFSSKYYATVSLSGPVKTIGYYSFSTVLGTQEFTDLMLYSKLDFSFFIKKYLLGAGIEYASGNQFGLSSFRTVTYQTGYNSLSSPEKTEVILPKIFGIVNFGDNSLSLTEKLVLSAEEKVYLTGLESSCSLIMNIFSDLQVSCNLLIYSSFYDKRTNNFALSAGSILSF